MTVEGLEAIARLVRQQVKRTGSAPSASGLGSDWHGLEALATGLGQGDPRVEWTLGESSGLLWLEGQEDLSYGNKRNLGFISATDGWGNPLRYRCPGVVHKHGWDVYSCGPNGKDDQGTFDDICVGEDVAVVASR